MHLCAQCGRTYWLLSHRCAIAAPSSSASLRIAFPATGTRRSSSPITLSFFLCVKIAATLSLEAQTLDGDEWAVVSRTLHLLHRWASGFGRSIAAAGRVCPTPPNAQSCGCAHVHVQASYGVLARDVDFAIGQRLQSSRIPQYLHLRAAVPRCAAESRACLFRVSTSTAAPPRPARRIGACSTVPCSTL